MKSGSSSHPEEFSEIPSDSVFRRFFLEISSLVFFTFRFFKEVLKPPYEFNELMKQSYLIGYKSLPLTVLQPLSWACAYYRVKAHLGKFWSGIVVACNGGNFNNTGNGAGDNCAHLCRKSRIGIGAELASMNVTEQIDAMQVSGTNPFKYLVVTRVLSATLMLLSW